MAANLKENISLLYYRPLSDEKSAATVSHRDFNERAWWRESWGKRWQDDRQFFISWLPVARQWPDSLRFNVKSLHHQSDPHDYCEINSSSAVILDVHNRAQTPAKTGHTEKDSHIGTLQTHMHIQMHNYTHLYTTHIQICWIGSDLSDLAASTCVPLLNAPVSSLPSSKLSFAILSKASLMPPITEGLQAGRFGARRLGRRVCYASGPFNRVVICCCWCWSCLCRLINGKLPSLWRSARSTKPKLWGETQKYQAP